MNLFEQLGLNEPILKAISDMGFETPSEIQQKAIPTLLANGADMVALAQTGTGKTAAFGFPLLQLIDTDSRVTQGLILSPTRELCLQIASELRNYAKYLPKVNVVAVYGGASIEEQARSLKKGAQIIVATPGRMQDMIRRNFVDISHINYCVLDEADEMLNMGFYEDITAILSHTPQEKSTWLFSATMPNEVAKIARKFMRKPIEITVGTRNQATNTVQHEYYIVSGRHRYQALKRLADANPDIFSVVFCRTKRDTQAVAEKLIEDGYNAAALHGDLSQNQRDLVMKSFRARQIQMLVATDVAARGIDVDDITHVIHYQLPDEIETYNHRSGRTGRAGKSGISMVILPKSEVKKIKTIEKMIGQPFEQKQLPSGMEICEIQLYHLANNLKNTEVNPAIDDYLPAIYKELKNVDRDELIKKIFSVEFTRFFNYYKNAENLSVENERESRSRGNSDEVRYFINIGERDGYDWKSLKDFLKATLNLGRDDVFKVDVKNSFSFFNTDADLSDLVMDTFNDFQLDGRFINVELSTKGAGRDRGGSKRGNDDGRKHGNDEGRNRKKGQRESRKQKTAEALQQAFKKKKKRK
ncbi:DEAD/DEAH box helicase domain protein [Capnocytophaga ochracea DSM 7271]|uniref:DEAD/DEAH box helicase domain protein n=1 Tax=Capnocytophaga ochracea (strain ATCC 27872 / DSM 7271 / CCUG 9716 / JCM 12966 / NCTC 12371 / SS31 / VPI 2845) TaxID=521097 RepID=C7M6P2_CAPOD|nr:DEAD/DEAH box helicase [Capnocytophaga ochracea]ACU92030.1 DEAD/DEAH box helicase domain protein [Capnocytophaga ochracea DSM 7271]UAK50799.1 DEAD/DEAH box helicase [Capnocytophaga ochracea]